MTETSTRDQQETSPESPSARGALKHAARVVAAYALLAALFFSPVLFSDYLVAPGDGMIYFLPNFYARRWPWDASLWGGFPAVGDSQLMTFYPPSALCRLLGGSTAAAWHAFLVSAYVLACSFAYGYAHAVTRSPLAAAVAGTTYGMGGFFVAHAGHPSLVHAAAWTPAVLWSLEMLARGHATKQQSLSTETEQGSLSTEPERRSLKTETKQRSLSTGAERAGLSTAEQTGLSTAERASSPRGARRGSSAAEKWRGSFWFAAGALAVGCSALAGHPQMFTYALLLGGVYALARGLTVAGRRARLVYYLQCALVAALGAGLAAVQLVPTAELAGLSLRASLGFEQFVSYSLPLRQTPMLLFPYLFGGAPGTVYGRPYFGAWGSEDGGWGAGELSGYAGLLPLVLAAVGFLKSDRRRLAWLWLAVAAFAFLLALGDKTPLARVAYLLPVVNKFRVPARHYMELTLAVSVLAALGVEALRTRAATRVLLGRVLGAAALLMLALVAAFVALTGWINAWATERVDRPVTFLPWENAAVAAPLIVLAASAAALLYWRARPASLARRALLLAALIFDLGSFTWFYEWHYAPPYRAYLAPPPSAARLRDELAATRQRLLPARGGTGRVAEIPPNLSKLWGFPSASGYGPFTLARLGRALSMPPHGSTDAWQDPANRAADLLAARFLIVPRDAAETTPNDLSAALPAAVTPPREWAAEDFAVTLGAGCGPPDRAAFNVALGRPVAATSLKLVSALACSASVEDGAEFARVTLTDAEGKSHALALAAGRDSAEWAADCADVRPQMRHAPARIFRSYPVTRETGVSCEGHDYLMRLDVPADLKEIASIRFDWTGKAGVFVLKKLTLTHESAAARAGAQPESQAPARPGARATQPEMHAPAHAVRHAPVSPAAVALADETRWRRVAEIDASGYPPVVKQEDAGASAVYENLRAMPRAWLVGEVLTVSEPEALEAVRASRLPGGRDFDPRRVALVEEPYAPDAATRDPHGAAGARDAGGPDGTTGDAPDASGGAAGTAEVVSLADDHMEVLTRAGAPAFLVTSDVFYPGWRALIDGRDARLFQTDYLLRGVAVPAGEHRVRFEFRPRSLRVGASVSLASLLLVAACALALRRAPRP